MKFALVGPAPPFRGGISQYNGSLAKALKDDHEVVVLSFAELYPRFLMPGRRQREDAGTNLGVPVANLLSPVRPWTWWKAARWLTDSRIDAVLIHWWHPLFAAAYGMLGRLLKKKLPGVPILILCHNVFPHERLPIRGIEVILTKWAFRPASGFLVHSEKLKTDLASLQPGKPARRIFHPVFEFYREWKTAQSQVKGSSRLLFFGTIREYKGLDVLIDALPRVAASDPGVSLTIAGEPFIAVENLKQRATQTGVADRIEWKLGYVSDPEVARLLGQCDLVVLPYRNATQSGVVPLAYEFDIPVVATRVGGLEEVVIPGETGYLVPPDDPGALAEAILQFLKSADRESFRKRIRGFRRELSWEQVVGNMLALVQEVKARNGR